MDESSYSLRSFAPFFSFSHQSMLCSLFVLAELGTVIVDEEGFQPKVVPFQKLNSSIHEPSLTL
jgi:hypothetical protein